MQPQLPPPPSKPTPPPLPPYYGPPSPPRTFVMAGLGWAYGIGCGAGPFFGLGVAVNRSVVFGAGTGAGVFCGVGFGAGAVVGAGHGFVPLGLNSSLFYAPRLGWAENMLERYRERHDKDGARVRWPERVADFWRGVVWPRIAPVFAPRDRAR